jgi:hypothetical protein
VLARIRFPRHTDAPSRYPIEAAGCSESPIVVRRAGTLLGRALQESGAVLTIYETGRLASRSAGVVDAVRTVFHADYRLLVMYNPDGDAAELAREIAATLGGALEPVPRPPAPPLPEGAVY